MIISSSTIRELSNNINRLEDSDSEHKENNEIGNKKSSKEIIDTIKKDYSLQNNIAHNDEVNHLSVFDRFRDLFKNNNHHFTNTYKNQAYEYFKRQVAFTFYIEMKSISYVDIDEYIHGILTDHRLSALGVSRNAMVEDLTELLKSMNQFTRLEMTLEKSQMNQNDSQDDVSDDLPYTSIFEAYIKDLPKTLHNMIADIVSMRAIQGKTTESLSSKLKRQLWGDQGPTILSDNIYRDVIKGIVSGYNAYKQNIPNLTNETFAQLWACRMSEREDIGRSFSSIKSDIMSLLRKTQNKNNWDSINIGKEFEEWRREFEKDMRSSLRA